MGLSVAGPAPALNPQQAEQAIKRGVEWLYSRQQNGNWEEVPLPDPDGKDWETRGRQWGGRTAIATYALLAAGQDPKDPRLQKALEFLKESNITGTYAIGMRSQVWQFLPRETPERRALIQRDARLLMGGIKREGSAAGMFNYYNDGKPGDRYDHSCSNYGVLGLWAAAENNVELPTDMWGFLEMAWRQHQYDDGSWSYMFQPDDRGAQDAKSTVSMTAAGVATLFITQDYVHSLEGLKCTGNTPDPHIERGIKWLAANFDKYKQFRLYYALYNISRVGVASGHKYFDTVDWFQRAGDYIIQSQRGDGSWDNGCGDIPDTCFCILFLVRGRAPVVINKLEYTVDRAGDNPAPITWNQRPRDVANLTRWMAKQFERDLNWQIVNLKAPVEELHDAPILLISGSEALNFNPEQRNKLKLFVEEGGLIVGHADCGRLQFYSSFQKLGKQLFPTCEFRDLPAAHVIYTDQQFKRTSWRLPPKVMGLSNGARELMLSIPIADPGKNWQTRSFEGADHKPGAQLMADIFLYAVDKQNLRFKGETYIVQPNPRITPSKTIKLARLQYNGNWDPEPGGWRRLAAVMQNTYAVKLETAPVKLGTSGLNRDYQAAHLTGTAKFTLDPASREELRQYVQGGGTVIVDACGGSGDFAAAVAAELKAIWPDAKLSPVKKDSAVYTAAAPPIAEVTYRRYAMKLLAGLKSPRLMGLEVGGRTAVYVSNEDLSAGLVGQSIDGIVGYDPKSASTLMSYMLLNSAGIKLGAEDVAKVAEQGK